MIIFLEVLQKISHRLMDDDPHCPISLLTASLCCAGECCLHWAPATCCMSSSHTPGQSRGGRRISSAALRLETWQRTFWCWIDVVSPKHSTFWLRCCPSCTHEIFLMSDCPSFFIWQMRVGTCMAQNQNKQTTMRLRQILPRSISLDLSKTKFLPIPCNAGGILL